MLKIGITGGIGSGKTTVCQLFELLGIPVYYADQQAKRLMVEDNRLVAKIKEIFGKEAYLDDGILNRAHLAAIAFNDPDKLNRLNAIVHPAVAIDSIRWQESQKATVPYCIKEAALLFESGSYLQLDKIITVFAPRELRIQRVLKRDQSDRKAVEARMSNQMPEADKLELTHFIINNNGEQMLLPQVFNIHQTLLALNSRLGNVS